MQPEFLKMVILLYGGVLIYPFYFHAKAPKISLNRAIWMNPHRQEVDLPFLGILQASPTHSRVWNAPFAIQREGL